MRVMKRTLLPLLLLLSLLLTYGFRFKNCFPP